MVLSHWVPTAGPSLADFDEGNESNESEEGKVDEEKVTAFGQVHLLVFAI